MHLSFPYTGTCVLLQNQFTFIHDVILESVTCGDTQINSGDLRSTTLKLKSTDEHSRKTGYEIQFQVYRQYKLLHVCVLIIIIIASACETCTNQTLCTNHMLLFYNIMQILNLMTPKSNEVKVQAAVQHKAKNRSMEFLARKSMKCMIM